MRTEEQQHDGQAARADVFAPERYPRRVNLGCGFDLRQGYLNIDFQSFHHPDLVSDVRSLPTLPSDYYDELVAQDVLEHLPRTDTLVALCEWSRVLTKGGILRLRVPDLNGLLQLFCGPERQDLAQQEELVHLLYGTQAYTGDFHQTGFTNVLLSHYLAQAGFDDIVITTSAGWLLEASAKKHRTATPPVPIAPPPSSYRVEWLSVSAPQQAKTGAHLDVRVHVRNAGEATWPKEEVFLSYHWLIGSRALVWDGHRTAFAADLAPGEQADCQIRVTAPLDAGECALELTLVHEGIAWFEQRGALTSKAMVLVTGH